MHPKVNKLFGEPLVHFLILGAAMFIAFDLFGNASEDRMGRDRIVVTAGHIQHLITLFTRSWQRPPSPEELKGLVDDYVEEEILSREAIELGLDRDDTVIRRRLKQKMEFIYEDMSGTTEPTDADLQSFYQKHADNYRADDRLTFQQVFVSEARGARVEADARSLLENLRSRTERLNLDTAGDPTFLPRTLVDETYAGVLSQFGPTFAEELNAMPDVGEWQGPIRSTYGLHLVLISSRVRGRLPELEEVRAAVARDLKVQQHEQTRHALIASLLDRYEVSIEWPDIEVSPPLRAASVP